MDAMMDLTRASGRAIWPEEAKAEVALELAQLSLFAANQIVTDRLKGRYVASIDPVAESAYLASDHGTERARNTAQMFAEQIWTKVYDRAVAKYPLLIRSAKQEEFLYKTKKRRSGRTVGVRRNHFVPAFATKPWSDTEGSMLVVQRRIDGGVRFVPRAYRNWGYKNFLYPAWLEDYFHAVESDAAIAYGHLLRGVPLPPDEKRIFTSFLVLQLLRTPAFIAQIGLGLRKLAAKKGWSYPTDPGSLRRAYETLFRNDELHGRLHAELSQRRWRMLRPSGAWVFPRIDTGIVQARVGKEKRTARLFPLSPSHCLCIGPSRAGINEPPFPVPAELSEPETTQLISSLVSTAVESVALPTEIDRARWEPLLARFLGVATSEDVVRYRAWGRPQED